MKDKSVRPDHLPEDHRAGIGRREFLSSATAVGAAVIVAGGLVTAEVEAAATVIQITSAWGPTPKVLTVWRFRATLPLLLAGGTLDWSGTGTFQPMGPAQCLATFDAPGPNTVKVTITRNRLVRSATLNVTAKDASGYARIGSRVECPADTHGCPACPHAVTGSFTEGLGDLLILGRPAVHVGHKGVHAACCGPNTFELEEGDPEVLCNGKALGVVGSRTRHCGGIGKIVSL